MKARFSQTLSSKLSRKGLVIIAIPVLFAVMFILSLKVLLNEAQAQADKEARAKNVILCASNLGRTIILTVSERYFVRLKGGKQTVSSERLKERVNSVRERFDELQASVKPHSVESEIVERIHQKLSLIEKIMDDEAFEPSRPSSLDQLSQLMQKRKVMSESMVGVLTDADNLSREARKTQMAIPISQERYRQVIDVLLYGGVVTEVFLAIGLMTYFSSDITKRLAVLMDNSKRLSESEELNPIVSGDDEIAHLDKVFHDMAVKLERARAGERAVLERLQGIIETIPLGILVVDNSGRILSLSPRGEKHFCCARDEWEGRPITHFFSVDSNRTEEQMVQDLLGIGKKSAREFEGRKVTGETFPCEIISTAYNTVEVEGRLLVFSDISERYEVERLKQSFVSMVSHELRSPLTSLQVCLKMISRGFFGTLNDEGQDKIGIADQSVQRLISLVNEILDVERLESGSLSVTIANESLQEILELAVASIADFAQSARIDIETETTELRVKADKNRLVQVLVNLLGNAIKFSPPSSSVKVRAFEREGMVEVHVIDQGRGIPEEQRDLIFKRFHQVRIDDEKGGAGLGLSICQAIVHGHGGELGVESESGTGSTFWIRIPSAGTVSVLDEISGEIT